VILLDTHVLVWMTTEPDRLSKAAQAAIRKATGQDGVLIASITLLEVARLAARGRLQLAGTVQSVVEEMASRVGIRPITPEIAAIAAELPDSYPGDPADRLIGATALCEGIELITRDRAIRDSGLIRTVW